MLFLQSSQMGSLYLSWPSKGLLNFSTLATFSPVLEEHPQSAKAFHFFCPIKDEHSPPNVYLHLRSLNVRSAKGPSALLVSAQELFRPYYDTY